MPKASYDSRAAHTCRPISSYLGVRPCQEVVIECMAPKVWQSKVFPSVHALGKVYAFQARLLNVTLKGSQLRMGIVRVELTTCHAQLRL